MLSPLAFIFADLLVYFAGFSTVFWLEMLIVLGFIAFAIYQARLPKARRTIIDPRAAVWVLPWLAGLLILSWLGRYNGSPPTVFGVTLLATNHLPNWWDLAVIAAFSLVIYYWAVQQFFEQRLIGGPYDGGPPDGLLAELDQVRVRCWIRWAKPSPTPRRRSPPGWATAPGPEQMSFTAGVMGMARDGGLAPEHRSLAGAWRRLYSYTRKGRWP